MSSSDRLRKNKNQHTVKNSKSKKMDKDIDVGICFWECINCGNKGELVQWGYEDMAERGNPVCPSCDDDMKLINDLKNCTGTIFYKK